MIETDHPTPESPPRAIPEASPDPLTDVRRRRLLFRATHRGTAENDLMIGGFVTVHLGELTDAEVDALEAVMEMPDTNLADWLTGRVPIPPDAATPMLCRMRDFLASKPTGTRPVEPPRLSDTP
jgi:antitoxin CptB